MAPDVGRGAGTGSGPAVSTAQAFAVVGAQKSATTSLIEMIAAHPDIYAPPREVHYFGEPYVRAKAAASLRRLSERSGPARAYGFKRADLLHRPEGLRRVADHLPDAKIIAVLRDPVSRTVSAYFHYIRKGLIPLVPIEIGLPSILDKRPEWDSTLGRHVVEFSQYKRQLESYRRAFADNFLVFTQDALRADPDAVLKRCFEALGVEAHRGLRTNPVETNLGVYSMRRLRWLRLGSKPLFKHRSDEDDYTIHSAPWRFAAYYGTAAVDHLIFRGVRGQMPELSDGLRARLGALFLPDIEAAEEAVGRPLPRWRQAALLA